MLIGGPSGGNVLFGKPERYFTIVHQLSNLGEETIKTLQVLDPMVFYQGAEAWAYYRCQLVLVYHELIGTSRSP